LNGTHQHLAYADNANLLGVNTDTIHGNIGTLIYASIEVCLQINVEETKYMLLSRHQNASPNHDIKLANRLFEIVVLSRFLFVIGTNQNWIQEKIKRRVNSGNACYQSVLNLLSLRLLLKP
jgi:hypothetical protein